MAFSLKDTDYLIFNIDDYDLDGLRVGHEYLLSLKGPWADGEITLAFNNGANGNFVAADDNVFNADRTECRFVAPSSSARLTVTTRPDNSVLVTCVPILRPEY